MMVNHEQGLGLKVELILERRGFRGSRFLGGSTSVHLRVAGSYACIV